MAQLINAATPLAEARAVLAANYDLTFSNAIETRDGRRSSNVSRATGSRRSNGRSLRR